MKKFLSIILSLAMLLSITAGIDFSAFAETSGDYEYSVLDDGTAEITKYKGSATNVAIPSTLDGKTVTSIGEWVFSGCTGLTSITIPDSVTSIGDYAFWGCSGLTSINIPRNVSNIGYNPFIDCSNLESITVAENNEYYDSRNNCNAIISKQDILDKYDDVVVTKANTIITGCKNTVIPNSVTSIGCSAFDDCTGLTSVTIPKNVTSIGSWAFSGCTGLTSINIPKNVSEIGNNPFSACSNLESITVAENNEYYDSRNNCNAIILKQDILDKYDDDVATKANALVTGCKNTVIPNSVTSIGDSAFSGCDGLTSITIPDSVTSIGWNAFKGCTGLTGITIPDGVTSIDYGAFEDCTGLKDVYYSGTQEQWNKINIDYDNNGNDPLKNATIHYSEASKQDSPSVPDNKGDGQSNGGSDPSNGGQNGGSNTSQAQPSPSPQPQPQNAPVIDNTKAQIDAFKKKVVKLKSVKKGKKSFTATWKKVKGVDGYQIQYSLKKNMKKSKSKTVKGSKKTKVTVKKLKKGKKYYVRVRTYKIINGNKVYGKWSAKKTVKVK